MSRKKSTNFDLLAKTIQQIKSFLLPYLISDISNIIADEYLEYTLYSLHEEKSVSQSEFGWIKVIHEYYGNEPTGIQQEIFEIVDANTNKIKEQRLYSKIKIKDGTYISVDSASGSAVYKEYPNSFGHFSDSEMHDFVRDKYGEKFVEFAKNPFWEHENEKYRRPLF